MRPGASSERAVILAPTGRDAAVAHVRDSLAAHGGHLPNITTSSQSLHPTTRSLDPQRCTYTNAHGAEFSEAMTSPGRSAGLRFCLKQMLPRPGIELLKNRPELSSECGQRIFNAHRHFGEHLSFDKAVPLEFPQLLRQYLLRDSRHALQPLQSRPWTF